MAQRTCSFDDCEKPRRSLGLCEAHYYQQRRGGPLRPLFARRTCSFEGCTERHSARGMCVRHYVQQRAGRELRPLSAPRTVWLPPRGATPIERLHARAVRSETAPYDLPVPCLIWTGSRTAYGHGQIHVDGKNWTTHRLAFFVATGHLPPVVRHRCDVPPCIEPTHLEAGTPTDNVADREARGRTARVTGEARASAKLTWDIVRDIRSSTELGYVLAARLGVSKATISLIRSGRTWKE